MRAVKFGVTRDYVLAMTVVLPSGEVVKLGKAVCKTSSGYSLLHLMIGSEGTLGVITELTLKLIPKPLMDVSLLLPFEEISAAIASEPEITLATLAPQSIEAKILFDADKIDVCGATGSARMFGLSETLIGLTIVAMGTSMPEAAVSITAALKQNAGITIGNVTFQNVS